VREHSLMRLPAAALVLSALALASCGGSSHKTTSSVQAATTASGPATAPTTPTTTQTQPATTSTSPTTSTPTPTSTATPVSGPPLCRAADLAVSFLGGQGATGHGELGFALRNTGGHSCHTYGFPGVLFLGRSGQVLPTNSTRTTQDFFGSTPLAPLVLDPGANASFRLGVTHGVASTAGCTTAAGLQVIPPDDTATLRVAIGNGGAYECGTATVSPLRPGNSAYP
jgi:hypothetical protein